ncbi:MULTISPECIES: DUF6907 domain-containing protein [Streptomyces]|uniref:Uncharacterized protein n=1 Tax=Streptomyces venezuelae (strain ATCC 10712 / CBS 650.69 / DSM 40230 / JCM 4526 / NBRC 13096 / PD 04745) TaxID=953739 RepID=F2RFX8_STRVP|nr:hypothetical protein [Streptomyces venezuelae]APE23012.1 hypothetical protein vnz_19730 [Streptomyces venezuelae]CCA57280.1 hypothetical protein SVEN_3994 [Streptomyces venezuelae ATCC 10712]
MSNTVQRAARIPVNLLPGIPAQPAPQPRLVPTLVGAKGRAQRVYIECPEWCTVDHSKRIAHLDDVTHYSDGDVLQVSTFTDEDTSLWDLTLNISADPSATDLRLREAHLVVDVGGGETAHLNPSMADELADDLIAFASQLRHKARQVALFNRKQAQR